MKKRKRIIFITAVIMFAVGAAVGFFAMRQGLAAKEVKYRYVYCAASGLFLGAVAALSAKSVVFLATTLAHSFASVAHGAKPSNVVCVSVGITAGTLLTWLLDFLIKDYIDSVTVRIIADVAFMIVASSLLGFAALKIFCAVARKNKDKGRASFDCGGYVLSGGALGCDGIYEFCRDWLLTAPVVLDVTVSALISGGEGNKKALDMFGRLHGDGIITAASCADGDLISYAKEHSLKIIAATADEFDCCEGVLAFTQIGSSGKTGETPPSPTAYTVKAIDEM